MYLALEWDNGNLEALWLQCTWRATASSSQFPTNILYPFIQPVFHIAVLHEFLRMCRRCPTIPNIVRSS